MCRQLPYLCVSLSLLFLYIYFGEVGVHTLYSLRWAWPQYSALPPHAPLTPVATNPNENFKIISSVAGDNRGDTRILILADPHIQCSFDQFEPLLFRWDSDWYVGRAIARLVARMEPDVVVVVGDVFAEGYKASESDWHDYLLCLHEVLALPREVRLVVLPGDNDIGGEGAEGMTDIVNKRYVSEFGPLNEVIFHNGVTLIKVNTVSYIHSHPISEEEAKARKEIASFLRGVAESTSRGLLWRPVLVFSHVPFSELRTSVAAPFLSALTPDFIFSGHTHHESSSTHSYRTVDGRERAVREWTVPTCSYRMGEAHMGVGAVFIDCHGNLGYTVLWLPPRYPILISYLFVLLLLLPLLLSLSLCPRLRTRSPFLRYFR